MKSFFTFYSMMRYHQVLKVALPLIIINLTQVIMQFSDRKFLSIISTDQMSAAMPGGAMAFTLGAFFLTTVNFATPMVAQYFGKKDFEACARVPWVALRFALLSAFAYLLICAPLGYFLIHYSGHPENLILMEKTYFFSLMPSFTFAFIMFAFNSFFSGRGITWIPSLIQVFCCALNLLLNYALIFGHWGFPRMEILGAGLATSCASFLAMLLTIFIFLRQNQTVFKTRNYKYFSAFDFKQLIRLGSASGVHVLTDCGAFTTVVFLIGKLGTVAMATSTIALTVNMIAFLPLLGMGESVSIIAGQSIGKNRLKRAEHTTYATWQMGALYTILIGVFYVFFGEQLCNMFAPQDVTQLAQFSEVVSLGKMVLCCVALYAFFDSIVFIFMGGMRGAGDTHIPMWIVAGLCWGIWVPVTYIMVKLNFDIIYIWIYMVIHLGLMAIALIWRYRSGAWKRIKVVKAPEVTLQQTETPFI